jgi:hypothetical protein
VVPSRWVVVKCTLFTLPVRAAQVSVVRSAALHPPSLARATCTPFTKPSPFLCTTRWLLAATLLWRGGGGGGLDTCDSGAPARWPPPEVGGLSPLFLHPLSGRMRPTSLTPLVVSRQHSHSRQAAQQCVRWSSSSINTSVVCPFARFVTSLAHTHIPASRNSNQQTLLTPCQRQRCQPASHQA